MRRLGMLFALLVLSVASLQGTAVPAETTSLEISSVTVGTNLTVSGLLTPGTDATGPTKVATDGSGDALPPRAGFDIGDAFVTPDLAGKKLTLTVNVNDGIPGVDGIGPAAGYVWSFAFDGTDNSAWLAAGTFGSGWLPKAGKWWELCSTTAGSYTCGNVVPGTMTASQVSWTIPFKMGTAPTHTANYGSTLEPGSSQPGSPAVIPWAVVSGGSTFDATDSLSSYKIPGQVEVGIAPAGTTEDKVQYSAKGVFNPTTGSYSVQATKPAAAGSYTVFARSCFGNVDELTCVKTSQPLTI